MRRLIPLVIALLLLASGVRAQDGGVGVIIEANASGSGRVTDTLQLPIQCADARCERLYPLGFPTLFTFDPPTGAVIGAQPDNVALVQDWSPETGILHVRADLVWSDGSPITAYDVLFTLVIDALFSNYGGVADNVAPRGIAGMRLIDEQTLALDLLAPVCSTAAHINLPIGAMQTDPTFRTFAADFNTPDAFHSMADWLRAYQRFQLLDTDPDSGAHVPITGGLFTVYQVRPGQDIRLVSGDLAYAYVDVPPATNPVEMFLNGTTNLLINPPYNRRDDLRAAQNLQISELPGAAWDYLLFNVADPAHPQDAFAADGTPRDQGVHPIFGDVRVRRAVQLAIDMDQIIEVVFQGNASAIPANLPPTSWGYNADLAPVGFDPVAAGRLLDEAGWRDTTGDGLRECYNCLYAGAFRSLAFSLRVDSQGDAGRRTVANLIAQQLRRVGMYVNVSEGSATDQTFDAYLTGFAPDDPLNYDPDQSFMFTQAADRVNYAGNVSSYTNPQVETLLQQANNVPACAVDQRATLYRELQTVLQADQPAAWLYTRTDFYAARGIENFAPYPNNPFWNIRAWVVHP